MLVMIFYLIKINVNNIIMILIKLFNLINKSNLIKIKCQLNLKINIK
jgi:hypothetical protein